MWKRIDHKFAGILILFSLLLAAALPAAAERPKVGFLVSIEEPAGEDLLLVTRDGREFLGRIARSSSKYGSVTKVTFRTYDGLKVKLRADEIERIEMPINDFWKSVMVAKSTDTLEEIWKTDFERIFEVDRLEFHSIRHPKSERVALRQLINPGFDSRFQVYYLPSSKEGISRMDGMGLFGDMPYAFLVVKDGQEPIRVTQRRYREQAFPEMFADCPELLKRFQGDMRKFKFFAEHVFLYDQLCPGPGSPTYPGAASAVHPGQDSAPGHPVSADSVQGF